MRLAIIVTEFPKVTETFILRDVVEFLRRGNEVRVYHLRRYRHGELVHDFARPVLECAQEHAYLLDRAVLGALWRALRRPGKLWAVLAEISSAFRREPIMWLKSLVLLPQSLRVAEDLLAWQADHVHAEFAGHPATSAWIVGRFSGLPYSVSCRAHDIFITQSLLSVKLGEAAVVRTISRFNEKFLHDEVPTLEGREVHVIHSSLDLGAFPAPTPAGFDPFRVFFVGSHHRRKGIDVLLKSLADLDATRVDWRCRIAGSGPESERLRQLSAELGLDSRVEFLGPLPFEQVVAELVQCSVLVAPSTIDAQGSTEGIPNVAMEALACARPVIATSVSGIPELVEHGVTGFLAPPGDARALTDALLTVHGDPEAARACAFRGRERIESEFNLQHSVERQLELFREHSAPRQSTSSLSGLGSPADH